MNPSIALVCCTLIGVCVVNATFTAPIEFFNKTKLEQMVIGGADAERHQFPHIVSLQLLGEHQCGGSILSSTWVVTAGHCCDKENSPELVCSNFFVVAGMLHQGEQNPDIQNVSVAQVVHHPKYYHHIAEMEVNNDIALLRLSSRFNFTHTVIRPVKLPSTDQEFEDGWSAGWGIYKRSSLFPVTLQFLRLQIINNTHVCVVNATFRGRFGFFNKTKFEQMVIGGVDAERHQFPHIASLQLLGEHLCGGSILSSTWVVTAGHCCDEENFPELVCSNLFVVAAMLLQSEQNPDIQNVSVAQVVHHPKYYFYIPEVEINNDIALLRLSSRFNFAHAVRPVRLPSTDQEFEDGWAVGWGVYKRPSLFPVTLQFLRMQIINNTLCQVFLNRFDEKEKLKLFDTLVCAMPPTGYEGACSGDSGGPLLHDDTLVGIVSWGVVCRKYHLGAPSVFTDVTIYVSFIKEHVKEIFL